MFIALSSLNDDPPTNRNKYVVSDVFGIGKVMESLASSFGKLLEKIPSNKLTAGMSFVVIVLICVLMFILAMFYISPKIAPLISIWASIFALVLSMPFIWIECVKSYHALKKSK